MTKALNKYNGIDEHTGQLPVFLEFNDIKSLECEIWQRFDSAENFQTESSVPYSVRKEAVEINCTIERCQEENILVKEEMNSLMSWLLNQHSVLLNTIENSDSNSSQGVGSVLCKEALYIEMELDRNNSMFSPYIGPTLIQITFSQYCYDEVKVTELLNYIAEFENIKDDIETEDESDKGSESECDSEMDSESDSDD